MSDFAPYANESQALTLDGLSVENRLDRVAMFGNLDLTKDKIGLQHARHLKAVLDAVVAALEKERDLPEEVAPPIPPTGRRDPFA